MIDLRYPLMSRMHKSDASPPSWAGRAQRRADWPHRYRPVAVRDGRPGGWAGAGGRGRGDGGGADV